jgi:hypothetical protein
MQAIDGLDDNITATKLCQQHQVPILHVPIAFFCVDKIKEKGNTEIACNC